MNNFIFLHKCFILINQWLTQNHTTWQCHPLLKECFVASYLYVGFYLHADNTMLQQADRQCCGPDGET